MFAQNVFVASACRRHRPTPFHTFYRLATTVPPPPPITTTPEIHLKREPKPQIRAGIILNRSPILTQAPTAFESAYYEYQTRIRRALHNPFPYEFYFKQGSPLEARFTREEHAREREAFGLGEDGEGVKVEEVAADGTRAAGADQEAEESRTEEEGEEALASRIHEADVKGDVQSLDRRGDRNLYLLLLEKGENPVWRFPQGELEKGELLHQAAQRDLYEECGERMDVWIVSRTPIGVYHPPSQTKQKNLTFFIKAHILAGQVRPDTKAIKDFAWLTKEEIEERVERRYWNGVKDMLSDH